VPRVLVFANVVPPGEPHDLRDRSAWSPERQRPADRRATPKLRHHPSLTSPVNSVTLWNLSEEFSTTFLQPSPSALGPRSSVEKSTGFLNRVSQVRFLPGAPLPAETRVRDPERDVSRPEGCS
jgi:hypothetical protein